MISGLAGKTALVTGGSQGIGKTIALGLAGEVDTPLFQQLVQRQAEQLKISPERAREDILREVPIGRPADPTEIANVVVFLASDMASYVNGAIVGVDEGWTKCV